ncbi:MAG: histidine phosphatase family protein [Deltaproteobacteria bacterium]|nr:histidine phosphatase family protein [Deltaproteobacteria bacterium]
MKDNKLYIVMVGLPARGKSTISIKIQETFRKNHIPTMIFNNGNLRRKHRPTKETYHAGFYDPENKPAVELRKKFALININRAKKYLRSKGQIAILDATNVSRKRRELIEEHLNDHPVLFIECINNDKEILDLSITQKTKMPEFNHLDQDSAIKNFLERIRYYEMIYTPLWDEKNFIKIDSLNNKLLKERVSDHISYYSRIRDFLVTDIVKNLFLIRHTETYFNLEDRIGGDPELTQMGKMQAIALARFFKNKKLSFIFTSQTKRTVQTAEPIKKLQQDCTIVPLKEFNEIDGGICDSMTYQEIRERMPEIYLARKADKYNYIYPQGEGYVTMKGRVEKGIKKALYLNRNSDNIMIVGHRGLNRMILAHFLYRRNEDVPYIYIPQDKFYHITATQDRKLFQLKKYE